MLVLTRSGVAPLALNDFTSGFNIATHITHSSEFSSLCGFTEDEAKEALRKVLPAQPDRQQEAFKWMQNYFNGYLFHSEQKQTLFNSTLAIAFLSQAWS